MLLFLLLPILPYLLLHLLPSTPVALPSAFPSRNAALILTAHPDDETMFFSPMIQTLVGERIDVYAACMSTGNAVGLGDTRRKELVTAYEVLGINSTDIALFDHLDLRDGMATVWAPDLIASLVQPLIERHCIQTVISFDSGGVSSHPNHIALSQTLPLLRAPSTQSHCGLSQNSLLKYQLISLPLHAKYLAFLPLLASSLPSRLLPWLSSTFSPSIAFLFNTTSLAKFVDAGDVSKPPPPLLHTTNSLAGYKTALGAMMEHWSQLVWFRWGYVGVSRYMWEGWYARVD